MEIKKPYKKFVHINPDYDYLTKEISGLELNKQQIEALARYMSYAILRTEKQLERWRNHPQDDGQVTYMERRKDLQNEIELFKEIAAIKDYNKQIKTYNQQQTK